MRGEREAVAGDEWLTRYPADHRFRFRVDSGHPIPGWRPRQAGTQTRATHAGTAIFVEDTLLEVVAYETTGSQPPRHCYFLAPWNDQLNLGHPPQEYSVEVASRRAADRQRVAALEKWSRAAIVASPVVSTIPGELQEKLEREIQYPAILGTVLSACLVGASAVATILFALWASKAPEAPRWARNSTFLLGAGGLYFTAESLLRIGSSMGLRTPMGSLPVAGPIQVFRAFKDTIDRTKARNTLEGERIDTGTEPLRRRDRVTELAPDEDDRRRLEVVSALPKDHWTLNRTGLRYRDLWFMPTERDPVELVASDQSPTSRPRTGWRFVLVQAEGNENFKDWGDYQPEEVQEVARALERQRLQPFVDVLALVWGLMAPEDRQRLENTYGFAEERYARFSIWLFGILAAALAFDALRILIGGQIEWRDPLFLLLGLTGTFDALRRHLGTTTGPRPAAEPTPQVNALGLREKATLAPPEEPLNPGEEPDLPLIVPGSLFAPLVRGLAKPLLKLAD